MLLPRCVLGFVDGVQAARLAQDLAQRQEECAMLRDNLTALKVELSHAKAALRAAGNTPDTAGGGGGGGPGADSDQQAFPGLVFMAVFRLLP